MSKAGTTGDSAAASSSSAAEAPRSAFVTTHWSVVVSARDQDEARSAEALEKLCRSYWYPLYVYVRRQGHGAHDAQDLTQEFFARLLEKDSLRAAAREKGRFRTFLLVALKRFLANEWDRARAQKRGGGRTLLSLDTESAERRYRIEAGPGESADRIYDRRWALAMLDNSMTRLRGEFVAAGRAEEFERLKVFLTAERGSLSYGDIAATLGTSEGAARVAVHRLRKRFRELFREEIAHTIAAPEELEEEIRYLMSALAA